MGKTNILSEFSSSFGKHLFIPHAYIWAPTVGQAWDWVSESFIWKQAWDFCYSPAHLLWSVSIPLLGLLCGFQRTGFFGAGFQARLMRAYGVKRQRQM